MINPNKPNEVAEEFEARLDALRLEIAQLQAQVDIYQSFIGETGLEDSYAVYVEECIEDELDEEGE